MGTYLQVSRSDNWVSAILYGGKEASHVPVVVPT